MIWLGGLMLLLTLGSCGSSKKLTYVQDMEVLEKYPVKEEVEIKIQPKDKLDIVVTCKNPELAMPFNIVGGTVRTDANGDVTSSTTGVEDKKGYVVDKFGNIDFPVLGELYVQGLTLEQLKNMIEERIKEKNYIRDPMVLADFMNFKITILGEVGSKGNFTVEDNEINLLQAVAMAGDLTNNAKRKEVMVIRTENGERTAYEVNMLSKDMYDSPAFQLQQNDVVYVKPNKNKSDGRFERNSTVLGLLLTFVTAFTSFYHWVLK